MQVEVDDEKKVPVRTDVQGCGKVAERGFAKARVVFRRVLPDGAKRASMCDGDVVKLSIGRNNDAMWAVDVDRHLTGVELMIDARARRPETDQRDLVGALCQDSLCRVWFADTMKEDMPQ